MDQLVHDVQKLLGDSPKGMKAREIAKALGTDNKSVNQVLYGNEALFKAKNYVWSLAEAPEEPVALFTPEPKVFSRRMTDKFLYYNCNPYERRTDDCVIRAISGALHEPWADVFRELTEYSIRYGYMLNTPELYGRYLKDKGWKKNKQPQQADGKKVRISEFLETFKGDAVAHAGAGHITYLSDGSVLDIWDCSREIMGVYWTKK